MQDQQDYGGLSVREEKYSPSETLHLILFPGELILLTTEVEGAFGKVREIAHGAGGNLACGLMRTPVSPLPAQSRDFLSLT